MDCPSCDARLVDRRLDGISTKECPECAGLWLTDEGLRRAKDEAEPELRWMDFELWEHPERFVLSDLDRECPTCEILLVELEYEETGVEVDLCSRCRGVWLDAGELEDIVAALREEAGSMEVGEYVRASLREARDLIDGPESLASEWKDLASVLRMLQYRIIAEHPKLADAVREFQEEGPFR